MLIDFNEMKEITVPKMNSGAGEISAKMYIDGDGKIIPCRFENVIEIIFQLKNVVNTIHFNSVNNSALACVGFRNINFLYTAFLRLDYHGQNSVDSSDFSRKRKLTDKCAVGDVALNLIEQYKNCNGNRQIVNRSLFFDIGRGYEHNDFVQEGLVGLLCSCKAFDQNGGASF